MFSSLDEFKCGQCHSSYKYFLTFLEHKIQHAEPERPIECFLCCGNQHYFIKSSLVTHLSKQHFVELTACDMMWGDETCDRKSCLASAPCVSPSGTDHNLGVEVDHNSLPVAVTAPYTSLNKDLGSKNHKQNTTLDSRLGDEHANTQLSQVYSKLLLNNFNLTEKSADETLQNVNNHSVLSKISHQKGCHPFLCESNLLTNNVACEHTFEQSGSSAECQMENKLSDTAANIVHSDNISPNSGESSIKSLPNIDNLDSGSLKFSGATEEVFQETGQATRILLPLPLDLSSTQNLCQTFNLTLRRTLSQISEAGALSHKVDTILKKEQSEIKSPSMRETKINTEEKDAEGTLTTRTDSEKISDEISSMVSSKIFKASDCVLTSVISEEDAECSSLDFYFLLGNMNIKGNSLTYQRTEFRCLHCSFSTAWRPSLVKHMKQLHKDTLDIHSILDIRNLNSPLDASPKEGEKKWKDFQVMKMSQYLVGNQKLKPPKHRVRKLERQDIPGKYHCPLCHKVFGRLRYMRRHQSSHRTERTHLCDNCGKSFKTKAILVAHRRSHKSRSYHCPQCSFVSGSSAAIHAHRQLHPNGSVICEVCGNAYIDKSTLNKHMKVHDLSRPFPCTHPGCTWRFKTDVMRKAHVRSHTTIGKFSCSLCGYNFRQKHHLQRHITKIHQDQQVKNVTSSAELLPSYILTLNPHTQVSSFITKTLTVEEEVVLESEGNNDLGKNGCVQDPSTPPCGLMGHGDIFTPSSNQILYSVADTTLKTRYVDPGHNMIEALNADKGHRSAELELEDEKISTNDVSVNNLTSLGYVTDTGEVVQLVPSGHTYVARDHFGNLVHYKLPDVHDESSPQLYLIDVNNATVIGNSSGQTQ